MQLKFSNHENKDLKPSILLLGEGLVIVNGFLKKQHQYHLVGNPMNFLSMFLDVVNTYTNPAESFAGLKLRIHSVSSIYGRCFVMTKNNESFYMFGYSEDHFAFLRNILRKVK